MTLTLSVAILFYFLDYCLGRPASEKPNVKAILFFIPLFFAKRRLRGENLNFTEPEVLSKYDKKNIEVQKREMIFLRGRELFTWENALGMCPVCSHFWLGSIIIFFAFDNYLLILTQFLISHLFLRIILKYA